MLKALATSLAVFTTAQAAQLTLSQALKEALAQNPAYQAAQNDVVLAEKSRDSAIGGYLPVITASGGYGKSWQNTHQQRASDGSVRDVNNALTTTATAGVNADWTLFQGFSTPLTQKRLRLQADQARAYEAKSREDLVRGAVLAYAELARQTRLYHALDTVAVISEERARILEQSLKAGAASRSDWLSARVDLNGDQASLKRQAADLQAARVELGRVLGRSQPVSEEVDEVALPAIAMDLEKLLLGLPEHRPELQVAENSVAIAHVSAQQRATNWLPKLDALAGYNYTETKSDAGIYLKNRTLGPSVGLQLNFNLFSGEFPWSSYQRAKVALTSAGLRQKDLQSSAEAEVRRNFAEFEATDSALTLESEGLGFAHENLSLTFTRWKAGSISYLDARRAQEQYLDAVVRSENTAYDALRARLDLLRSAGRMELLVGTPR